MSPGRSVTRHQTTVWLWLPVVLCVTAIFVESSIQQPPSPPGPFTDKDVHALMYGVLCALVVRALAGGWLAPMTLGIATLAVAITTLYGVSDEVHQRFVPSRTMDAADVAADATGAVLAAAALAIASRRRRRKV
jgi:VanZ family protein